MKYIILVSLILIISPVFAEGWDTEDESWLNWFASGTVKSCCDYRDAYVADEYMDDGHGGYIAIITDGSANEKYNKPAIPNGTRIPVPQSAFKKEPVAPGHGVIFLMKENKPPEERHVFCYFPPISG